VTTPTAWVAITKTAIRLETKCRFKTEDPSERAGFLFTLTLRVEKCYSGNLHLTIGNYRAY
jgi:hypothetical protein